MPPRRLRTRRTLLVGGGAALVLAVIIGGVSLVLPGILSRDYDQKSLASLRRQSAQTRQALSRLLASLEARKEAFDGRAWEAAIATLR